MRPAEKGIAQSVRQRLLNRVRETGEDYNLLLNRYAIERLLFRLSQSRHADQFVLKGAMLFTVWTGALHRPTRDLDLLGFGERWAGGWRFVSSRRGAGWRNRHRLILRAGPRSPSFQTSKTTYR